MVKPILFILLSCSFLYLGACVGKNEIPPVVQPVAETEKPVEQPVVAPTPVSVQKPIKTKTHSLGIIGEVEPVYFPPMKSAFFARMDTGAKGSSIDVSNLQEFEREGKKWVSFDLVNRRNGETHHFEKRLVRQTKIKRQGETEERLVVTMTIRIGKEKLTVPFSLADRSKFDYQALIGRNILTGRAIVDTSLSKTLY